jgi:hypothetical protein
VKGTLATTLICLPIIVWLTTGSNEIRSSTPRHHTVKRQHEAPVNRHYFTDSVTIRTDCGSPTAGYVAVAIDYVDNTLFIHGTHTFTYYRSGTHRIDMYGDCEYSTS